MSKKPPACPRCGGEVKPVAGLPTCQKCGERLQGYAGNTGPRNHVPGGTMRAKNLRDWEE